MVLHCHKNYSSSNTDNRKFTSFKISDYNQKKNATDFFCTSLTNTNSQFINFEKKKKKKKKKKKQKIRIKITVTWYKVIFYIEQWK